MKILLLTSTCLLLVLTTLKAQIVPGTRVSMNKPEGFTEGQNFTGYQKGEEAMINVMDLNGGNFYSNAARFTRENFEARGIEVLEFEELTVNGFPARYVKMQGDPNVISINMVFGDSTFSAMLMGVYPSGNDDLGAIIKQSILSANYQKNYEVDPFANAFFRLDDSKTALKFSQANANIFFYTIDGATENNEEKPVMLVLPLPNDNTSTPKETSESMIAGLESKGLSDVEFLDSTTTNINGYTAYELLVKGKINGALTSIFVQTIINGENQLVIQGMKNGGDLNPDIIRELSSTVKMK